MLFLMKILFNEEVHSRDTLAKIYKQKQLILNWSDPKLQFAITVTLLPWSTVGHRYLTVTDRYWTPSVTDRGIPLLTVTVTYLYRPLNLQKNARNGNGE